jgi:hypothetical protein
LVAAALAAAPGAAAAAVRCTVIEVDGIGPAALAALVSAPGLVLWVEADDELLACAPAAVLDDLERGRTVRRRYPAVEPDRLALLAGAHRHDLGLPGIRTLVQGGRTAVVEVTPGADLAAPWHPIHAAEAGRHGPASVGAALRPLAPGTVLARQAANSPPPPALRVPGAAALAEQVDPDRWFADVVSLASFNRHTRSTGPGSIADARDWLVGRFEAMPGLAVSTQQFLVGPTTAYNVIARLDGTTRIDDWYLVGAHYDARTQPIGNSTTPAPGAEDNGSGCAAVLEMARLLTAHPPEATVFFLCYSGEEQGLWGSVAHSNKLVAEGDASRVRGMLNMDMIGFTEDSDLDCLLESEPSGQGLVDALAAAAGAVSTLRIVTRVCSGCAFGSDHVPYLDRGIPAVLSIENDWDDYPHYHQATDLPSELSLVMGGEVLKMEAAALAELTGAGGPVALFADGFESGDLGAWSAAAP